MTGAIIVALCRGIHHGSLHDLDPLCTYSRLSLCIPDKCINVALDLGFGLTLLAAQAPCHFSEGITRKGRSIQFSSLSLRHARDVVVVATLQDKMWVVRSGLGAGNWWGV